MAQAPPSNSGASFCPRLSSTKYRSDLGFCRPRAAGFYHTHAKSSIGIFELHTIFTFNSYKSHNYMTAVKYFIGAYTATRPHSPGRPNFQQLSIGNFCRARRSIGSNTHIRKPKRSKKIDAANGGKNVEKWVENYLICPHLRNLKRYPANLSWNLN